MGPRCEYKDLDGSYLRKNNCMELVLFALLTYLLSSYSNSASCDAGNCEYSEWCHCRGGPCDDSLLLHLRTQTPAEEKTGTGNRQRGRRHGGRRSCAANGAE